MATLTTAYFSGLRQKFPLRSDNPQYLGYVKKWYTALANELQGTYWKDGGPVYAIQVRRSRGKRGKNFF